ncbi:MAG: deoxyribonuclease IV [Candidatus Nanohaloarchaea archaeon]|nr:deoxyribonuclease IV [Candidatus Nanohaloarchaea archaeon]
MTLRIGAHVSIAGGFTNALDREEDLGGNCGQVFVHSPRTWGFSDLSDEEAEAFRDAYDQCGWGPIVVHSNYLINLATPKDDLHERSVETLRKELQRTGRLAMEYVNFHPGSHTGAGVDDGLDNIADGLDKLADDIPDDVVLLLENTAGKGTSLGRDAAELRAMIDRSSLGFDQVGVCIDTCHAFAAGYDLRSEEDVQALVDDFDEHIGWDNVHAIHLNDSKHPHGSEKDEHEHIGQGEIGEDGMRAILRNEKIRGKPLILETPESDGRGFEENIEEAKRLAGEDA